MERLGHLRTTATRVRCGRVHLNGVDEMIQVDRSIVSQPDFTSSRFSQLMMDEIEKPLMGRFLELQGSLNASIRQRDRTRSPQDFQATRQGWFIIVR